MDDIGDNLSPIEVETDVAVDARRCWWEANALFCSWLGIEVGSIVVFSPLVPIEVVILEGPMFSVLVFFKVKVVGVFLNPMWVSSAPLARSHGSLFEVFFSPMEVEWLHGFWGEGLFKLLLFVLMVEGACQNPHGFICTRFWVPCQNPISHMVPLGRDVIVWALTSCGSLVKPFLSSCGSLVKPTLRLRELEKTLFLLFLLGTSWILVVFKGLTWPVIVFG